MALADNKVKIQALLAGINALPEAGSGEAHEPVLQEKTVTPTKAAQSVTPDTGFDGLSKVNVDVIPDEYIIPSGTKNIEENGTHDVNDYASVNVAVPKPVLQRKTVMPTTSAQEVVPDEGYDGLSQVNIAAMQTAERAKPAISVSGTGLITVTSRQPEGYVEGGVETVTRQLQTTNGAMSIRPGTTTKVAAYCDTYITGANLLVEGDKNLVAGNIKKGVSIFGVAGSYEASGGSETTGGTCLVTINTNDQAVFGWQYNNGSGWVVNHPYEPINKTITVAKGTLICLVMDMGSHGNVDSEVTGGIEHIAVLDGIAATYVANSDGTLSITPVGGGVN